MSNPSLKNVVTLNTQSPKETFQLGMAFGLAAQGGEVIALIGTLGAGKTQFVKGLAVGLEILPENVTSPTFALMQSYEGRLNMTHIDLYRLENRDEICDLGLQEEIEDGAGLAAIEWADKAEGLLPPGRLMLSLKPFEGDAREIAMQVTDVVHQAWLDRGLKNYAEQRSMSVMKASK